jgi:type III restriction enzyme
VVATGEEKGLEQIGADYPQGIADPACPVKFVITQKALAEGWDCPFAYILVSMAALHSATAVEQLLGRVLRQPGASHRPDRALNQSYAFVVSQDFAQTASSLRDRLVSITLSEKPDLKGIPKPVRDKVTWNGEVNTLTISAPLTEAETEILAGSVASTSAATAIAEAATVSRTTAIEYFETPAELGERFCVPQLALRVQGELQLFDDPEVLDYPWDLSPHASKQAFVAAWLTDLLRRDGFTLARVNLQKFLIRNRLERRIRELRRQAVERAYQQTLFSLDAASCVAVTDRFPFEFHGQAYAPSRDYDGRFGTFDFRRHFHGRIGDFDTKEEFECACWLDTQAQKGRLRFWIRNLVRREGSSFFLQKADGRFYPDFLCQLPGTDESPGPVLAVEYKGGDRWAGAEDDRLIGGLWASLSEGRCRFVMVRDRRWEWIDACLH